MLVEGLSGGAPSGACDTLSPNPMPAAHGADPQTSTVPYSIDISAFMENGTFTYYPGQTYTCEYISDVVGAIIVHACIIIVFSMHVAVARSVLTQFYT